MSSVLESKGHRTIWVLFLICGFFLLTESARKQTIFKNVILIERALTVCVKEFDHCMGIWILEEDRCDKLFYKCIKRENRKLSRKRK
ncbi:hypothetical protein ScPMuIL_017117 [Solemya velum]